ncbi:MAG TPA: redoxin domain-containing protein [Chryseolinea sp.]
MKYYTLTITLITAGLFFCCSTPTQKTTVESPVVQTRNDLPNMTVTSLDETHINLRTLKDKTILILFQPDCDHCQREAKEIRENLDAFKNYSLYFISADQFDPVKKFGEDYDLITQPNVHFALTTVDNVLKNFGAIPAPSVYIYADQKLVKKFNGEVSIGRILQAI